MTGDKLPIPPPKVPPLPDPNDSTNTDGNGDDNGVEIEEMAPEENEELQSGLVPLLTEIENNQPAPTLYEVTTAAMRLQREWNREQLRCTPRCLCFAVIGCLYLVDDQICKANAGGI